MVSHLLDGRVAEKNEKPDSRGDASQWIIRFFSFRDSANKILSKWRGAMIKKHSPGLTLVELIIVLAVMMIGLAVAMPDIATFSSGYKLKAAAREVATDLQFTRILAVKENKAFQVIFGSNSYQVVRLSDGIVAKSRSFAPEYPDLNLTSVAITFDSRGISNGNTVTIANARGTKNVSVAPTGRVKIE